MAYLDLLKTLIKGLENRKLDFKANEKEISADHIVKIIKESINEYDELKIEYGHIHYRYTELLKLIGKDEAVSLIETEKEKRLNNVEEIYDEWMSDIIGDN